MEQSTNSPAVASIDAPRLALFDPEAVRSDNRVTTRRKRKRKGKAKAKPQDFPLTQRADGRWCKRVCGRYVYFGKDREQALALWLEQKDDLLAGRTPRNRNDGGLLLGDLCERFLNTKLSLVQTGELSIRTFADYRQTCNRLVDVFGKYRRVDDLRVEDFERLKSTLAKTRGLVGIENGTRLTRMVFKHAVDTQIIGRAVMFGPTFRVKRDKITKAARGRPPRVFDVVEVRKLLSEADDVLRCMILLAVNCGFGQSDLASLPQSAIDLQGGWVSFPRVKTGAERKAALWPETIAAIRKAIPLRPGPKSPEDDDLLFVTKYGRRFTRASEKGGPIDAIAQEFGKLLLKLKIKRPGLQFYALRHTFRSKADETRDFPAIDRIMGHSDSSMGGRYREYIDDARLKAVTDYVRHWLFPSKHKAR